MGETGCGKTYLVKYIVKVLFKHYSKYREFIFHTGVEEEEFKQFMYKIIDEANAELKQRGKGNSDHRDTTFWVFFDEFNTSHLQAFVSEMMNDRVFSLGNSRESKIYFSL
jgi:MoxR-like ATPase